ncbi:MAG: 2-phospho-L-lactate transferase [Candidatus Methanoperedens sp.]|nr:2-phospho-L-lactate transferase [Candidatus Methanoperedens sp.]
MIVLSGGTGTPKLLQGLRRIIPDENITVIVNTAEDIPISGNLISPDMDTVLYLFAGILDDKKWWGIKNDTFKTSETLTRLGYNEKLMLGDTDRAICIFRSELMRNGASLTDATMRLSTAFGIRTRILPMCDEKVDTMIRTPQGTIHFQDFWVGAHGEPDIIEMKIKGIEKARPTNEVLEALANDDYVMIGPSNPITSVGPILELKGVCDILENKKVVAVSPIIGDAPVSGPAGKLMTAMGFPVSSIGVARSYGDILDVIVIDERDTADDRDFNIEVKRFDTMMTTVEKSEALAGFVMEAFREL